MSYRWQPSGAISFEALAEVGLAPVFPDQGAAEAWLTNFFDDLIEAGVASVSLLEEDRLVYGPMSLEA